MQSSAEQITGVITEHGEGPCWDTAAGVLRFVDLLAGAVMTLDVTSGAVTRTTVGTVAACLRPRRGGGLVVALERQVALIEPEQLVPDGGTAPSAISQSASPPSSPSPIPPSLIQPSAPIWDGHAVRFNDGGCDPAGRFWVGTMAYDETPGAGTLYRVDPDGSAGPVLGGVTISNGLRFAADGTWAYYIDTPTQRVDVLSIDPDTGTVVGRRPFVTVPDDLGHPDGLTVDAQGGVWVALWGGSAVHRYAPDGTLDAVVRLPVAQVSCPGFGGPGLAELYVTTSRQGLGAAAEPAAGALFRIDPGVGGVPEFLFAG